MKNRRFILNADDLGMSKAINTAVLEGYSYGILKSASLVANGKAFDDAIQNVIPKCYDLGIGVHLNLTDGYSLGRGLDTITDRGGEFSCSYKELFKKSYEKNNEEFLKDVEREFRLQIEKILSKVEVSHIDSHQHIHSIPPLFEMVCRLAKEYKINQVRTHFEKYYLVPEFKKFTNKKFFMNIVRVMFFGLLALINEATIHKYELKTNDYIIGILYDSLMDALTVSYGLNVVKYNNTTVEVIIHPKRYEEGYIDNFFAEFLITKNKKLKNKIEKIGFEITNYVEKN